MLDSRLATRVIFLQMDMGLLFFSSFFLVFFFFSSDVSIPVGLRVLIQYGKWKGKERKGKARKIGRRKSKCHGMGLFSTLNGIRY